MLYCYQAISTFAPNASKRVDRIRSTRCVVGTAGPDGAGPKQAATRHGLSKDYSSEA